ncbi:MAG: hypothetical protein QHI48_11125 [Bacteroidota bacterium]|nr:hypothetical protein [Bacteroidota bacterium]
MGKRTVLLVLAVFDAIRWFSHIGCRFSVATTEGTIAKEARERWIPFLGTVGYSALGWEVPFTKP